MTIIQVHLLMLGLGLLAYLFLSGPLGNRKSLSSRLRRQWWLGLIAAIAVAASPLSRFWRNPVNGLELLTQSLLIAAISLLALMLFALLRRPVRALLTKKRADHRRTTSNVQTLESHSSDNTVENNSTPIVIIADAGNTALHASTIQSASINTTDAAIERSLHNPATRVKQKVIKQDEPLVASSNSAPQESEPVFASDEKLIPDTSKAASISDIDDHDDLHLSVPVEGLTTDTENLSLQPIDNRVDSTSSGKDTLQDYNFADDQANNKTLSQSDIETAAQMQAHTNKTRQIDDRYRLSTAANDNKGREESLSIKIDADEPDKNALDLSETEQLFAELREQKTEVNLPNEEELRQAKANSAMDELDFDTDLIQNASTSTNTNQPDKISTDLIEEAEVVEIDDASVGFGNDLTGEYSHPDVMPASESVATVDRSLGLKREVHVPETLDAAIIAAKVSALSLQTQVSSLENSITELDELRDSTMDATIEAAEIRAEHNEALLKQKDDLLKSENEARAAAESVIAAQSALIDRAKRDQAVVNSMLVEERIRLGQLQNEVERSRKMARSAASLARRAAVAQQANKDIALREQTARLKSEASTRKAVSIARNAISALAAEERKRGVTNH